MSVNDHDHDPGGFFKSAAAYVQSLDVSARMRYMDKLCITRERDGILIKLSDPYSVAPEKWINNPSMWPPVSYADIYNYFIATPGAINGETLRAYKALDAYKFVQSGKVQTIMNFQINESDHIILRCKVEPSQRVNDDCHDVWALIRKCGTIVTGHCTCKAGLGETCSHLGALLFKVQLAVQEGLTDVAVTSRSCEWNQQFRKNVDPVRVKDLCLEAPRLEERKRKLQCRYVSPKKTCRPLTDAQLEDFRKIMPSAAFFLGIFNEGDDDDVSDEPAASLPQLPPTLQEACKLHKEWKDVVASFNPENCKALQNQTLLQSDSPTWRNHRIGCITASIMYHVAHAKGPGKTIISKVMTSSSLNTAAVKWGRTHEKHAINAYVNYSKSCHNNFCYSKCGLFVMANEPFLRGSPDGVISCTCCEPVTGIVEVKCPYTQRSKPPHEIDSKGFCLKDGKLLKTHAYYAQVQGQLAVCNLSYCDFVVWTPKGIHVERIFRDVEYWKTMHHKLKEFFFKNVYPMLCNSN